MCHDIVGVFYSVYNELGYGFLEVVYEEALAIGLTEAGLAVARQVPTPIWFRGRAIGDYKADLIVKGVVLLELKAAQALDSSHEAQTLNYLRATDIEVGLLLNFGPKPQFKRFVFENTRKGIRVHSRGFAANE
ncbi:MAG TPA: GxxExxY protein [Candidatus Angelobacter sp.]